MCANENLKTKNRIVNYMIYEVISSIEALTETLHCALRKEAVKGSQNVASPERQ